MAEKNYGFIGIGTMGYPMAINLRKKIPKTSRLTICELNQEAVKRYVDETDGMGEVAVVQSPKEVTENCDVIITMLPQGKHVWEVFTNAERGLMAQPSNKGGRRLFIDCSTIDTATCKKIGAEVEKSGLGDFADAPVSGGPNGAIAGTLTFMIGGGKDLFEEIAPIASLLGSPPFFCGPLGAGLATKQINNYLSGITTLGTCEAMSMGLAYGLDPKVLAGVINVSSGRNYNCELMNPVKGVVEGGIADKDFEGGFSMELCVGVLRLGRELRRELGARSVLGETMVEAFEEASEDIRCQGKDSRSIYRWFIDEK